MSLDDAGYDVIKHLIPEDLCSIFTAYALFSEIQKPERIVNDSQVVNTYALFADPFVECLLGYCYKPVSAVVAEPIIPTYSYYRIYRPGAELKPHTDRPECEISVSVCLGFDYVDSKMTYPLCVEGNPIPASVGDGIVYLGFEKTHHRDIFTAPPHAYHVQAFLHYVRANGQYANRAHDGRFAIGYPRQKNIPHPHHATLQNAIKRITGNMDTESDAV